MKKFGRRERFGWRVLLGTLLVLVAAPATGQITENNARLTRPNSRLHRAFAAPVFITGHVGIGGGFQYDQGMLAYGASVIFRPGSASRFLEFLHPLGCAMVLRLDHQELTAENRIYSADLVLRRYFANRGTAAAEVLPFVGGGVGASDLTLPAAAGGGNARYWSWSLEAGQEWYFRSQVVVVARIQYRRFSYAEAFASTWTVSGAVGIPVPW